MRESPQGEVNGNVHALYKDKRFCLMKITKSIVIKHYIKNNNFLIKKNKENQHN